MLNIISSVTCLSLIRIDMRTIMSLHIVSRIYGSNTRTYLLMRKQCLMFMLLLAASTADYLCASNSKWDPTYTRTYLLMRKQYLMLLLAASEHAEKDPLEIKFRKDIVESYKPIVCPDQFPCCRTSVICRITTYFYLTYSFAVWVCTLEPRQPLKK